MTRDAVFDEALAAASAGAESGFTSLWRSYQPSLLRYLRVGAREAADDLASETWLEVARTISAFRGDEKAFRAWLFTIARHRLIDHQRAARRRGTAGSSARMDPRTAPDPAALAEERASTQAALALIAKLPRDQADAVALRMIAGLNVAQVARILRKREGTVRVLTHRGLRTLAGLLRAGQGEE